MNKVNGNSVNHRRSSRRRYLGFVEDYKRRRLDDSPEAGEEQKQLDGPEKGDAPPSPESKSERRAKRREYLRDYVRWLWPHRYAVGALFVLALLAAALELIEPLFMRFIIDRVLLNIGPAKAEAIVAHRKANGAFRSAEQLAMVKGIGLKTIEKNRDRIVLGAVAPARKPASKPAARR